MREEVRVFAISSACRRPRRIAATDGLFSRHNTHSKVHPSKLEGWIGGWRYAGLFLSSIGAHAMAAVVRAFFGYFFLVFIVRVVGRRPGKQMTPFEFVLIFFIGGLALTAMVGDEVCFTNAICQVITLGLAHYSLAWARSKSSRLARLVDGTPLILLENRSWRVDTLHHMRINDDDVIASARDSGIKALEDIDRAVLERNGEISISR
jgi:uncharacterized membrane protein YcaP (DUF421 family)